MYNSTTPLLINSSTTSTARKHHSYGEETFEVVLERHPEVVCGDQPCSLLTREHICSSSKCLVWTPPLHQHTPDLTPFFEWLRPGRDVSYGCYDPTQPVGLWLSAVVARCNAASTDGYGTIATCGCGLRRQTSQTGLVRFRSSWLQQLQGRSPASPRWPGIFATRAWLPSSGRHLGTRRPPPPYPGAPRVTAKTGTRGINLGNRHPRIRERTYGPTTYRKPMS